MIRGMKSQTIVRTRNRLCMSAGGGERWRGLELNVDLLGLFGIEMFSCGKRRADLEETPERRYTGWGHSLDTVGLGCGAVCVCTLACVLRGSRVHYPLCVWTSLVVRGKAVSHVWIPC